MNPQHLHEAITRLVGGSFHMTSDYSIEYLTGQTPPTDVEIDAEIIKVEADWEAQEYARNREAEFPSIQDLVVALYDTDDKSAVEAKRAAVKAKYPKPS